VYGVATNAKHDDDVASGDLGEREPQSKLFVWNTRDRDSTIAAVERVRGDCEARAALRPRVCARPVSARARAARKSLRIEYLDEPWTAS